jgi:hypothetical protein
MNEIIQATCAACRDTADSHPSELTRGWAIQHAAATGHTVTVEVTYTYTISPKDAELARRRSYVADHGGHA